MPVLLRAPRAITMSPPELGSCGRRIPLPRRNVGARLLASSFVHYQLFFGEPESGAHDTTVDDCGLDSSARPAAEHARPAGDRLGVPRSFPLSSLRDRICFVVYLFSLLLFPCRSSSIPFMFFVFHSPSSLSLDVSLPAPLLFNQYFSRTGRLHSLPVESGHLGEPVRGRSLVRPAALTWSVD